LVPALSPLVICLALSSCQHGLLNLPRPVDPIRLTNISTQSYLHQYRSKPAFAAAGKTGLSLEDCRRIALQTNLSLQVERWEEISRRALRGGAHTKVLPHLIFSGDLSGRDNQQYSFSDVMGREGLTPVPGGAGAGVTNFSTGHERTTWRYSVETKWSPNEAALAYYLYNNNCNERSKAHFQRVRIGQRLVGTVDSAYHSLVGLQKSLPVAEKLASLRSGVAKKARALLRQGFADREDYYRAKRKSLKAKRILSSLRNDMEKQRNVLAGAMGVSPDHCGGGFFVVGKLSTPTFREKVCTLEMTAVRNRPEAYIAGLNHVNSVNDLKRTIIKFFPKITGTWKYTRDKDRYLYNKEWKEHGMLVYFDLLDWLSNYRESEAAKAQTGKTHRQMGAVALGITSEVRVAALDYIDALEDVRSAKEALGESREMRNVLRGRASLNGAAGIAVKEAEGDVLEERISVTSALARANAALGKLQAALGTNYTEPLPSD